MIDQGSRAENKPRDVMVIQEDSEDEENEKQKMKQAFKETYQLMNNPLHPVPVYEEEDDEPLERDELPASKDPNMKISPLTILKDNIGKDLSKITMPVFFNEPMNTL